MTERLNDILQAFLCCNVCGETLRDPVSLGCNHNFCQSCLSEFCRKQSDKNCPLCRRKISRDIGGVNFSLKELADYFALQLKGTETGRPDCPDPTIPSRSPQHLPIQDERTRSATFELEEDLVDWDKPLAWQVGHLGEKYDAWVHKPVKQPIRLFESDFVEARTKAAWWIPLLWVPVALWLIYQQWTLFSRTSDSSMLILKYNVPLILALVGLVLWLFLTYCIHCLFHRPLPAHNYYLITLHFVLHGQHHKNPHDDSRLVFPLALSATMMMIFFLVLRFLLPEGLDLSLLLGIICGYVISDMVHYHLHHGSPSEGSWFYSIKKSHIKHHFKHPDKGLGITTTWFDSLFNTGIPKLAQSKRQ